MSYECLSEDWGWGTGGECFNQNLCSCKKPFRNPLLYKLIKSYIKKNKGLKIGILHGWTMLLLRDIKENLSAKNRIPLCELLGSGRPKDTLNNIGYCYFSWPPAVTRRKTLLLKAHHTVVARQRNEAITDVTNLSLLVAFIALEDALGWGEAMVLPRSESLMLQC